MAEIEESKGMRRIYESKEFPGLEGIRRDGLVVAEQQIRGVLTPGTKLDELHLSGLGLTSLPETLGKASQLLRLYLSSNRLDSLPFALGNLHKLETLRLDNNKFTTLPEMEELLKLQRLFFHDNQLRSLPKTVGRLTQLRRLSLDGNQLVSLPEELGLLSQLEALDLSRNKLTSLSESLLLLAKKGTLEALFLHENAALGIPDELLGGTWDEMEARGKIKPARPLDILAYYFAMRHGKPRPLRELKVILVGRGEVGKTTLAHALQGKRFVKGQLKTEGIAITPWKVDLNDGVTDGKATAHLWDFGGQQIMHGTHQFFMTHRALYLVVLDGRDDRAKKEAEYWLKLVRAFGGEASPVLLVLNKQGEHPFSLDSEYFARKYNIDPKNIFRTECSNPKDAGVAALKKAIRREAASLLATRELFPHAWWETKNHLGSMRERKEDYLSQTSYHDLCKKNNVLEEQWAPLLTALTELGVVVSFPEEVALADLLVLNPEWATDGVYRVLNDRELVEKDPKKRGHVTLADLKRILPADRWKDNYLRRYLVDLMEKFELCFRMEGAKDTVLVPELLPDTTPNLDDWQAEDCLVFLYRYPALLPQGILPRLITRTHEIIDGLQRWRSGVVLKRQGARALVRADYDLNEVSIWVQAKAGSRRAALLAEVRGHLDVIHSRIKNLGEKAFLTVPGHPDVPVLLDDVLGDEEAGVRDMRVTVDGERRKVPIMELLQGVDTKKDKTKRALKGAARYKRVVHIDRVELRDNARLSMDDIAEQFVAENVQNISGGEFHGPVAVHQDFKDCYTTVERLEDDGQRKAMEALLKALNAVHARLDAEARTEVAEHAHKLAQEMERTAPRARTLEYHGDSLLELTQKATSGSNMVSQAMAKLRGLFRKA